MLELFIGLIILGIALIYLANYLMNRDEKKQKKLQIIKTEAIIKNIEKDVVGTIYTVEFIKDNQKEIQKTIHYYPNGKEYKKDDKINIEYYCEKNDMKVFICDDELVPYEQGGATFVQFIIFVLGIISLLGAAYIALPMIEEVPIIKDMDANNVIAGIIIIAIIVMVISALILGKGLKKKSSVLKTKIIKKEYCHRTNQNEHYVNRYLFTIEHNGKKIVDIFEINEYTDSIKKGDVVEVRVYKKHFQFEKEWQEMMNKK